MATYILQYWRHSCHHRTVFLLVLFYWSQLRQFNNDKCVLRPLDQNSLAGRLLESERAHT